LRTTGASLACSSFKGRGDGQPVAADQGEDLLGAAEAGAHHDGVVFMLFEVVIDIAHRFHPGSSSTT
jgi:hypothetical protein